ncbi:hypothetical protein D0A34_13200 [Microcoleus vaginatus PCC 9802]|uniref:hypothetical protein n=1 Tax=Microcoleus vaginatus TaxID=119532 RepID=UPI000586D5C8|nr:hypothetical protein D0A34_13200 [Microcoleus vaginatus PCC 9802]
MIVPKNKRLGTNSPSPINLPPKNIRAISKPHNAATQLHPASNDADSSQFIATVRAIAIAIAPGGAA